MFVFLHCLYSLVLFFFFFFNDTATTEIYTLSLHDALPISQLCGFRQQGGPITRKLPPLSAQFHAPRPEAGRSEEHTSELQSHSDLVCRLLLEKKKKNTYIHTTTKKKKKLQE